MPPGPDSQSLTRLLVSAGTLLVVAAFLVPGLILRDTDVLTLSRQDLASFTPTAEQELRRRQSFAQDAGELAPYAGLMLLLGGVVLLGFGIPRLKRQESSDEERRRAELDKLRGEIRPQSAAEKTERLREDMVVAEAEETGTEEREREVQQDRQPPPVAKARTKAPPPRAPGRAQVRSLQRTAIQEAADAERKVLAQLQEVAPPLYQLESQVAVDGEERLLLDGLLISEVDQLPDIVVEVKYSRGGNVNLNKRISQAKEQLLRYLTRFRRNSVGWLIIVVAEAPSAGRRREVEDQIAADPAGVLRLSLVTLEEIDELTLPLNL